MHNNMKAFEYTKEIVISRISSSNIAISEDGGKNVAEFFETIFNKLAELEDKSHKSKND